MEAVKLARDSVLSCSAAIAAAYECGQLLNKAKRIVGHGSFERWRDAQFPDYKARTLQKWQTMAKTHQLADLLKQCQNLTEAYLLSDKKEQAVATGTPEVDIFDCFLKQIHKLTDKLEGLDLKTLPEAHKDEIRSKLREIEGRL